MVDTPRHSIFFRFISWVVIFTQILTGSAFADIKAFSKDTLAPQIASDSTPLTGDKTRRIKLETKENLIEIARRIGGDRLPSTTAELEVAVKAIRNYPPYVKYVDTSRNTVLADGVIYIPIKSIEGGFSEIRVCSKDAPEAVARLGTPHAVIGPLAVSLAISETDETKHLEPRITPESGADRDLRGNNSRPSNEKIVKIIKDGNMIEVSYSESENKLSAHRVKFVEKDYDPIKTEPSAYLVNIKDPVPIDQIVDARQAANIINWIRSHEIQPKGDTPGGYIKFRIALGNAVLHWSGDADSSNMSHAGVRSNSIYLGHELLKFMFQPGHEALIERILDKDEYLHILNPGFKHAGEPDANYRDRISDLEDLATGGVLVEGVNHSTRWGFVNEMGLDLIDDAKDQKARRALKGTTDLEILELDPAKVDVELALCDDVDFMPNRFNQWDGIVRSEDVAKVVVPQERFQTRPLRGVARKEIIVPSDEVSDSYPQMRQSVYVPVIRDHLENLDIDVDNLGNDPSFIGYVGNGNLLMNPAIVAWKGGVLYTLNGENINREYPCLVRFKNGGVAIKRLKFVKEQNRSLVLDCDKESEDITDKILFATSGISVLRNGSDSPIVRFIKTAGKEPGTGVDNELWQDYDIRHYASLPFLGSDLGAFGMGQLYSKGVPNEDLIAKTVAGAPIELKYEERYLTKLIDTLKRMGYDQVKSPDDIARFQYFLDKKNSTVKLRIEPALYPHNICVETEDGKLVFIISRGRSSNKGIAIADIPRMLREVGIKAKNAIVFDNGGDAVMNFKGVNVAPSFIQPPREWIMSMFVFKRNNKLPRVQRKAYSANVKDEFGKAQDRVRFLRSLYRYVERKGQKPRVDREEQKQYKYRYNQAERFILENSEFIASQLEKALDNLNSYIMSRAEANFKKPDDDSSPADKERYEREKAAYASDLRKKINAILAGAVLHEEDFRELLKGGKSIADYDANLRSISVKLINTVHDNTAGMKFEESDMDILPEVWRIKFASYFTTFFNGQEDPEYRHVEDSDVEEYIDRLVKDRKVDALLDILLAFRRIDKTVRYGDDIRGVARETFGVLEPSVKGYDASSKVVPIESDNDAGSLRKKVLLSLKDGSLRKGNPNRTITPARQAPIDLSQLVKDAKTFGALDSEPGNDKVWRHSETSQNYRNDWIEISPTAKIIFTSDKVVAYLNRMGHIELVVRGSDLKRVKEGKDVSRMSIILDQVTHKVIAMNTSEDNLPLSRTTLAIQLNDSGIFDLYPSLKDVLKTNLVWEEPSAEAREKDMIDLSQIDYVIVQRALKDPASMTKSEDVLRLIDFKYCKTKVIRQYALEALMRIYDTGHQFFTMIAQDGPKKGQRVMDEEKMKTVIIDFLLQDIEEDFRIVERVIKNDKSFIPDICREVFDVKNAISAERDITSIRAHFLRYETGRAVYKIDVTFSSSSEEVPAGLRGHTRTASLSLTRHDDIGKEGVSRVGLDKSHSDWTELIKEGAGKIGKIIQRPYVRIWETDYRSKELKIINDKGEETVRQFDNHICVQVGDFIPEGITLKDVMENPAYRAAEKREAVRAAIEAAIRLYEGSKEIFGTGYYIKHPKLEDFVLTRDMRSGERWNAVIVNMDHFSECDSKMSTLLSSFEGPLYSGYKDVIDETFALHTHPDLHPDILKLIGSDNLVDIAIEGGELVAHRVKYAKSLSGVQSASQVTLGDKVDINPLPTSREHDFTFTPREQDLISEWIRTRSFNGRQLRLRVATGDEFIGLGWRSPGEHAAIAANEFSDGCVYISYPLLKEALLRNRTAFRQAIFDGDILRHLKGNAFRPQEDDIEYQSLYKLIQEVVKELEEAAARKKNAKGGKKKEDKRNFSTDKPSLEKAAILTKDADILVFDVDLTIAWHRGEQIDESIAKTLYDVMIQKNGPKKMRIITGRSFEEINDKSFLAPLLNMFAQTNKPYDIEIYVSDGAEKYVVKNGEMNRDPDYSKPFTKVEADIIMEVLEESHRKLDREQELSKRGIDRRIVDESKVKFSYSPYGKSTAEYEFEFDDNEKKRIAKKFGVRKTRDELIIDLIDELGRRDIKDIVGRKGGASTIGFVRPDVSKKKALKDILDSNNGAKVVYFGDEFGSIPGSLPGNDSIVVDPDMVDNYPNLHVVALNERKEGIHMPKPSRNDVLLWVGGFYRGTHEILKSAYDRIMEEDPVERSAVADVRAMLSQLYGIDERTIERIYRFQEGKGTHDRFFKIDIRVRNSDDKKIEENKSYILRYANPELFANTLNAARYEVWLINTLKAAGIPVVPIVEKKRWRFSKGPWETDSETDSYITKGKDGRYYMLYEYMDGEGISNAPSNLPANDPRFRVLVENGARMHRVLLDIKEARMAKGLSPYPYGRAYTRTGKVNEESYDAAMGDNIMDVADFATGLKKVRADVDAKASDPAHKLTRGEHFILEHSDFILEQISKMKERLRGIYPRLRRVPIHGDWAPHNFLFKNDELVGVVDWEHSREEAMIFDLVGAVRAGEIDSDGRDTGRFNLQDIRTLIMTYVEAFNRLSPKDPITKEEIEVLPEIFRCRILYRLSRVADPRRYYEAWHYNFPGDTKEEEKSAMLITSDEALYKWHVELVTALFNLDEMISRGSLYRDIVGPLTATAPGESGLSVPTIKKPVKKPSLILDECLSGIRSAADKKPFEIPFEPLSDTSLSRLMAKPVPVFSLVKAKKYRWLKDGYMYTNGWVRLEASDKVLYERKKVVVYQKSDGVLYLAVRGYDDSMLEAGTAKKGRNEARIKISVTADGHIKDIVRDNVGDYDLSRSGIALELKDSGLSNDFPELEKALRYQLVWQDLKTDLRVRELRDASAVNLALIKKAMESPDKLESPEIRQIEEFVYLKSKILRRMGMEALARIYEAGKIDEDAFREWVIKFVNNDIEEDCRIIERGLKNNRQFVADVFKNLLGYENKTVSIDDIAKVDMTYMGQDKEKDTFKVTFYVREKEPGVVSALSPVVFSLIRHEDPAIGRTSPPKPERIPAKMDLDNLRQSIDIWRAISDMNIPEIAKFGGEFTEWDYRAKTVRVSGGAEKNERRFENNIQVIARQYAPGTMLGDILKDPGLPAGEKAAAIEAARASSREFYENTKKMFGGKGYFIENPIPREFVVTRSPDGKYSATIIGLERVADFPDIEMVEKLFDRHMPSPSALMKPSGPIIDNRAPLSLSILYADPAGLREEVKKAMASGIDSVHADHFDGTMTSGDIVDCLESIRMIADLGMPIYAHLWTKKLDKALVNKLMKEGLKPNRDRIVVPYEAFNSIAELVSMIGYIKSKGLEAGISINPETPISVLDDIKNNFDDMMNTITVMCVKPGGGGRTIEPGSFDKVSALKAYLRQNNLRVMIEIDGGITPDTYEKFFSAGADSIGARSIFIKAPDMKERVSQIRARARSITREGMSKLADMINALKLQGNYAGSTSFLAVCPMSTDIIKAYIELAKDTGSVPTFIATPRQVDVEGSYTGWSQKDFMAVLRRTADAVGYTGPILVERDHGGPWQRPQDIDLSLQRAMANSKRTYHADIDAGFDILHIDVTLDPMTERGPPVEKMVERTVELIADCEAYRVSKGEGPVAYEIGCDEPGSGLTSPQEVEDYLKALYDQLESKDLGYVKKNIIYLVVNTGTNLQGAHQTGKIDIERVTKFSAIAVKYGLVLKQHYTDYLDDGQLELAPKNGILGVNVGPEFSKVEYEALADLENQVLARTQAVDSSIFTTAVRVALDKTDRWRRWFPKVASISKAPSEQQREIILSCGRYVQEDEQVRSARQILYARAKKAGITDPEKWVVDRIKKSIMRYENAFKVKAVSVEPLIGHGFTAAEVDDPKLVPIKNWKESPEFRKHIEFLTGILTHAPPRLREPCDRILAELELFKKGVNGRRMGVTPVTYERPDRYYLGFGTPRSIGLGTVFIDPSDQFSKHGAEALFHELFHAASHNLLPEQDIEYDTGVHIEALRIAAQLFPSWGDGRGSAMSYGEAQTLSAEQLEKYGKNSLGKLIREWKACRIETFQSLERGEWKKIKDELSGAVQDYVSNENTRRMISFFTACEQVVSKDRLHPVEGRYPVLHAVSLLSKEEKLALLEFLRVEEGLRHLKVVDSIFLMLNSEIPQDWSDFNVPNLKGRVVYQISTEIWSPAGGLGRVMQFHGLGMNNLLQGSGIPLRHIEAFFGKHEPLTTGGYKDVADYESKLGIFENKQENRISEFCRFDVEIGTRTAVAVVYRCINRFGIETFLIKGYLKGQNEETENPYYTEEIYKWGNGTDRATTQEFSFFFSMASCILMERLESARKAELNAGWKAPVMHFNDGQIGLAPYFIKEGYGQYSAGVNYDSSILDAWRAKDFKGYSFNIIRSGLMAFTTHTYPNRVYWGNREGCPILSSLGIPKEHHMPYFVRNDGSTMIDLTSAGVRAADWVGGVSAKHVDDIMSYKYDLGVNGKPIDHIAVTNGDDRHTTSQIFRQALSETGVSDYEEITPDEARKSKAKSKGIFNKWFNDDIRLKRFASALGDQDFDPTIDPNLPVISYGGRGMSEKLNIYRAFTDGNIAKLVENGYQVVIGIGKQQDTDVLEGLKRTYWNLKAQKYLRGKFIFLINIDINDQRRILPASDFQIQDSDPQTEAAGYSESDVSACGGLQVAPPWREGILQTNGIPINWEIPGEGNVLVPKLNERDEDLARVIRGDPQTLSRLKKGNYDRNLCAKVGQAYLDIFLDISRRVGKPEEILRLIAPYEATSVRLSRPLETRITSAEYLRQWNAAIAAKEAVPSANKGSPRRCLETIFRSNLKYKNDISVKDDLLPKRSKTFDATYSIDTVREEVRILKALGILEEGFLPNTYRLRSQIRDLSPPDMERVLSISDLDRYTIPESEIPAVRERIEMIVPNPLIDPKDNSFNISISLGGTKVGVGAVNTKGEVLSTGDSIEWRNIYGDNAKSRDIVNAIMRQILSLLKVGTLHEKNMQGVGIAFAGPIDEEAGIVGTPFKAPNLPFDHYPLKEELEKILKKRFGRLITVTMYNDSKAALLGEMSPKGLLSGKTSGGIMILGTGVNITVAKNGAAYFGEKGEIKELGHNLVASLGADGLWHYRCTSLETLGDHPKFAPGEMDFEDRNGGPNLDKRFKEASGGKFGIKEITSAARKGDALAIKLIKETGAEIGRGIAAFQYAYRNEPFINDIVLVSSVSEKLGLGIPDDLGRDLLFGSIQDAAIEELVLMGMDRSDAEKAGRGIDRSHMTYERELVAFTPIAPDMFAGSSMRDMETIHDMNMGLLPPVETGKILYHVIPKSIVPQTIMGEFGKLARWTKNYRERIVVVDDKDFIDTVAKLSDDKNNKVLAAVPKEDMLAGLRSGVKALVFRSDTEGVYGFRQLEGVIAALRALERSDASALTRIYRILTGSDFSGAEKDILDNIGDPRGLAKFMIFNLKPVPVNYKELPVLNRRLLEFIRSA